MAGLAAAEARGRNGGRPSKLSAEQRAMARRLYDGRPYTVEEIGRLLGVFHTGVYRALTKANSAGGNRVSAVGDGGGCFSSPLSARLMRFCVPCRRRTTR